MVLIFVYCNNVNIKRNISIILVILLIKGYKYIKLIYEWNTLDFNLFIKNNFDIIYDKFPAALQQQYTFIEGITPNFIGYEETFDKDFKFIRDKFGINTPIKNNNIINKRVGNSYYKYIKKFDKETINFVNKFYKKDFEMFNYTMININ